eukprot:536384-Amphidinium_carterae.1
MSDVRLGWGGQSPMFYTPVCEATNTMVQASTTVRHVLLCLKEGFRVPCPLHLIRTHGQGAGATAMREMRGGRRTAQKANLERRRSCIELNVLI